MFFGLANSKLLWIGSALALFAVPAFAGFSVTASSAMPATVSKGQAVALSAQVQSSTSAPNMIVDLEIYNAAGAKVGQLFSSAQSFTAGQTSHYNWNYALPASAAAGKYTFKVGVFTAGWSSLVLWDNAAANFSLSAAATTPTIPTAPTGLVPSAGNSQVSLSWSTSAGATSYHVKRATTSGGPYTQVGAPTSASFTNSGLADGTKYYYVVSALDSAGESANSSQVSATPTAPIAAAPAAPTGLAANGGNALVSLTWSTSAGATSYHVKRATVSGGAYTQVGAPTSASFSDSGLANG